MKKIQLQNQSYQYLELAFKEWLDVLGYCGMSVYNIPTIIREFLHFLDTQGVSHIKQLQQKDIKNYHQHISTRANQRRGGGLSNNYINKHIQAIEKFFEFLHHKGIHSIPACGIQQQKLQRKEITILTPSEIKLLFEQTTKEYDTEKEQAMQSRDRAMLVVFYSCGLRRNEGVNLSIDDINFDTRILHVKHGKQYKERFVPLNKTNAAYLQEWVYDYRTILLSTKTEHHLFIANNGAPLTGGTLYARLQLLQQQSENLELQQKTIGLHTLRHSIATHLLQAGMSLEKISRFLGHDSLESTQIYTHLANPETADHH